MPIVAAGCMKILYVGNDRGAAQLAAGALHKADQDVTVTWAGRLADAMLWVRDNRDFSAVVVEDEVQGESCARFVRQVRSLGLTAPVIVVASSKTNPPVAALKAGADDYVTDAQSLSSELPDIISRARQRAKAKDDSKKGSLRLLYLGDAALARESFENPQRSIEMIEPSRDANGVVQIFPADASGAGVSLGFDVLLVEHGKPGVDIFAILKDVAARRLQVPVIFVVEWEEELILPALRLGAIDYVMKSKESFRALVFRLDRVLAHSSLLKEQSELRGALQRASEEHAAELSTALAQLAERQAQYETEQSEAAAARATFEQRLAHAETVVRAASQRHAAMTTAVAELHERQGQYEAQLTEVTTARARLEQQLNEAVASLEAAEQIRASDTAAASARLAERENELTATLSEATAAREALERRLAESEKKLTQQDQRATADREATLSEAARQRAELEVQLNQEIAARNILEQKLIHATAVVKVASQRHASMKVTIAQAIERQAEGESQLAQALTAREALEQQLRDASSALEETERARTSDLAATVERFTRREAQYAATIAETTAERDRLEHRLAETERSLRQTEQRAEADRDAASREASKRQVEFDATLSSAIAAREAVEQKLTDAQIEHQNVVGRHAAEMKTIAAQLSERQRQLDSQSAQTESIRTDFAAATERFASRERELTTSLRETLAARADLERQLTDAQSAIRLAERQAVDERQVAEREASRRQTEFDDRLQHQVAMREALERKVADAETTLRKTVEKHSSEMTAASAQLAERQSEIETQVAQVELVRADLAAATERFAQRETQLLATVAEITAARDGLNDRVGEAAVAMKQANQRAAADRETFAQRETQLLATVAEMTAARDGLNDRVSEMTVAMQQADQRATADREAFKQREGQLLARVAEMSAARNGLNDRVAELTVGMQQADQRATSEREASAQRETQLLATVAEITSARDGLNERVAEMTLAMQQAEQRAIAEREASVLAASGRQSEFDAELARVAAIRETLEQKLREGQGALEQLRQERASDARAAAEQISARDAQLSAAIAEAATNRETLERQLAEVEAANQHAEQRALRERLNASQRQIEFEARLDREVSAKGELQQKLVHAETALQQAIEQHTAEMATAVQELGERQAKYEATLAKFAAEEVARYRADFDARLGQETARREELEKQAEQDHSDRERLRAELDEKIRRFDAETTKLRQLLDKSRQERQRLEGLYTQERERFERAPASMLRCSREGTVEEVNQAFATLIGYPDVDEVRTADLALTVFETQDELRSLIERCVSSGTTESTETTWRRKDGARLVVRLLALASGSGAIEIVVENLTSIRELEEKLRQAQRMEAVGRLASEVAATCDSLLRDVSQDGHQWLASIESDTALRQQGELLLNEVTRAASFLRQLELYGKKQATAAEPVDMTRVLRDLSSVLKRVAGEDIEFVLPKTSSALNVDVELERVERILVNVAAYGRERLPFGGRLTFELANVTVASESVSEQSSLRPGSHVLITVTGVRYAVRWDGAISLRELSGSTSDRPGVDLGALQTLVRDCGGHLWMAADPPGDMILKIHLPQGVSTRAPESRTAVLRSKAARSMGKLFRTRH